MACESARFVTRLAQLAIPRLGCCCVLILGWLLGFVRSSVVLSNLSCRPFCLWLPCTQIEGEKKVMDGLFLHPSLLSLGS